METALHRLPVLMPRPKKQRRPSKSISIRRRRESIVSRHPWLVGFSAAYLVAALVAVLVSGNREFAFYLISLGVIIAAILWLDHRLRFSTAVLWCLSLWGAMHLAGGLMPLPSGWPFDGEHAVLYSAWIIPGILKYDHVVHAFGFGTAAVAALQAMRPSHERRMRPNLGQMICAALVACGLGSVNEILEFIATRISPETNVGGYVNTALDLVANFVGATIAMLAVRFIRR